MARHEILKAICISSCSLMGNLSKTEIHNFCEADSINRSIERNKAGHIIPCTDWNVVSISSHFHFSVIVKKLRITLFPLGQNVIPSRVDDL